MSNTPPDPIIGYTAIYTGEAPDTTVRFSTGETIYVESLHEGHWVGRYWSADGRINVPYETWTQDAFRLAIDGKPIQSGWQMVSAAEVARNERGARHFVVRLVNSEYPLGVNVHTLLDGTAVLTRWLEIQNRSEKPTALTQLSVWSGRMWSGQNFTLGYYSKDIWASEGWLKWEKLPVGAMEIKCDKGQGWDAPFFVLRNELSGEYFIGHLAWSANWHMQFRREDNTLMFGIGPSAVNALRVIAPGETIKSPSVHLGHVSGGLDGAIQAMHDHLRRFVLPKRAPDRDGLIQYLVPADQGYYRQFDEASALKCVDIASAMGAELFLLDAYWWDITLDWEPSVRRFPRGLQPLINYVHSKGMLFGLYVETEGGRGDHRSSRIGKQHPEWFGPRDVVKLSIPEAAAWVEAEVRRIIDTYQLDLYRLDYNAGFTFEGPDTLRDGIVENNYWRYYEVFYDLYERIAKDYPTLILQQCAGGGARNDLGVASRFHESYTSDGLSLPRELQVYAGQAMGLPPETFVTLHGADGFVGASKSHNLDTVLRMTYTTSTPQVFVGMVAPSVEELSPERRARFLHYGKIYKDFIRPIFSTCKMYFHEPINWHSGVDDSPWFAMEYSAPDRGKGWATIIRMRNGIGNQFVDHYPNESIDVDTSPNPWVLESDTYVFKPRGLDPARTYKVTFDSLNTTTMVDGLRLVQDGIAVRLENVGMSELLLFESI